MSAQELLAALDVARATPDEVRGVVRAALFEGPQTLFRAPSSVDITASGAPSVPMVAIRVARGRPSQLPISQGVVTATHLGLNRTWAALWEARRSSPSVDRSPPPPTDDSDEPVSPCTSAEAFRADLCERIATLPWRPGEVLVRLHLGDVVLGPERVSFGGGSVTSDPDVQAYLNWVASHQGPTVPPDATPGVTRVADEWTPAPPARSGVELVIQRVALTGEGYELALRGSFNLPLASHQIVAAASIERTLVDSALLARVSITLVFVSHEGRNPAVIELHLDASDVTPRGDGRMHARGVFHCDLFAFEEAPRSPGRYSVYAFANEHAAGAYPLTLVSEHLVPLVPPR